MLGNVEFGSTVVVADLEAGIGTLTRLGDVQLDAILVVVEPTAKSIEVGTRAAALADEKGLGRVIVVANRSGTGNDEERLIRDAFAGREVVVIPDDPAIVAADRLGQSPLDASPQSPAVLALTSLAVRLVPT